MAEERDRESPWWNGVFGAGRPARTEPSAIASPLLDAIPMTLRGGTRFTCVGEQPWALFSALPMSQAESNPEIVQPLTSSGALTVAPVPLEQWVLRQAELTQVVDRAASSARAAHAPDSYYCLESRCMPCMGISISPPCGLRTKSGYGSSVRIQK